MPHTWTLFHDVAALYLFVAADTDGVLDAAEVEAMVELLHRRVPTQPLDAVRRVVAEAHAIRRSPDGPGIGSIMDRLQSATLDDRQRGAMLDDLMHIARADGTVLAAEERFISVLARSWGIALPDDMGGAVHDLALVYLFMATSGGEAVDRTTRDLVTNQLAHWEPGLATPTLQMIVKQAVQTLRRDHSAQRLDEAIEAIKQALPLAPERRAVLQAVIQIAHADSQLTEDEQAFFQDLTTALELD